MEALCESTNDLPTLTKDFFVYVGSNFFFSVRFPEEPGDLILGTSIGPKSPPGKSKPVEGCRILGGSSVEVWWYVLMLEL